MAGKMIRVDVDVIKKIKENNAIGDSFNNTLRRILGMETVVTNKNRSVTEKIYKIKKHVVGRWPFGNMEVGDSLVYPWLPGWPSRDQSPIMTAVYYQQRRYGKKFHCSGTPKGLMVKRIG